MSLVSFDRRSFLRRAAAVLPMMHAGGVFAMAATDDKRVNDSQSATGATGASGADGDSGNRGSRFARLRLRSHCIDDMARFYRETLGLPVARRGDGAIEITTGTTIIEFAPVADASRPYYHFAFNIPHNKLDAAIKWLEPRCPLVQRNDGGGVIFHFPHWDAHAIYFLDPSGNIVEFIARHTLKNDAPPDESDFDTRDILCASEIGVVAQDVIAAADKLCGAAGLERYHGGSEEFTAVGNEHGLFIMVKTGRRWFSSDRAAQVFEAEAVLRGGKPAAALRLPGSDFAVDAGDS